jgi:zinc protease
VQSLRKHFPAALDLLADVVLHPSFPQAELERQRASRLGDLEQAQEDPGTEAVAAAEASLYGPMHAYGFIELGTEASVKAMTRDDLVGFWQKSFVPNNAALVVSGAISEADLRGLVEKAFGAWPKGPVAGPAPGTMLMPSSARLVVVDAPHSPQSQVCVAEIGVPRSAPDYASDVVMNLILGGLFSSRINLDLREDHGYTYGAFSQFQFRKGAGPFLIESAVRTDVTAPAITQIFKEVSRMVDTTVTDAELSMGRDALVRSLPADFETSAGTTGSVGDLFVYDLGLDFYGERGHDPGGGEGAPPPRQDDRGRRRRPCRHRAGAGEAQPRARGTPQSGWHAEEVIRRASALPDRPRPSRAVTGPRL